MRELDRVEQPVLADFRHSPSIMQTMSSVPATTRSMHEASSCSKLGFGDELAVDVGHAHARDDLGERHVGQRQRHRGAGDAQDVGVEIGVGADDEGDDLRLVAVAVGEQRAAAGGRSAAP